MGGSNSGRWPRQHVTLEGCRSLTLDINHLLRGERAAAFGLHVAFRTPEGRQSATIRIDRDDHAMTGTAIIAFNIRQWRGETGPQVQTVQIRADPRTFGGVQWFFVCPATGRWVMKLHLPTGGTRFLSRRAYRLRYAVQHESPVTRAHRRIQNIDRRLGHKGGIDGHVAKPLWMRWPTFGRLIDRRDAARDVLDFDMVAFLERHGLADGLPHAGAET